MSKDAKQQVLDMIEKKAKRYKSLKNKAKNPQTPQKLILSFIEEAENIYVTANDSWEWEYLFDKLTKSLDEQMKIIDLGAKMEVEWNGAENWRDLRVTGVRVAWSNWYKTKHSLPDETFMDVAMLLLQDFDDEEV